MSAHYFLGTRYLGQASIKYWDDTKLSSESWLLVCPTCGDVWARVADSPTDWLPLRMACRKHSFSTTEVGGSFIPVWLTHIDALPPEVLRYEAQLRLEKFDELT